MYVDHTPTQKALRAELRAYFAELIPPDVRSQIRSMESGPLQRRLIKKMGADGWLGVGWPREWGGQGRTAIEQQIWFEEARRAGAPLPFVTLNTVGPALIARGSEAQKRRFLPGILAGEIHFAIGYTEPGAGTDLAALETRAVREGDVFVVNGTKIFTSGADDADYIWLACRTDPAADKHKGISILIVDTQLPGFSATPIHTLGGGHTTMTYYENVRVPAEMLVGELNGGWKLITLQLNHERIGLAAFGASALQRYDEVLAWARETTDEAGQPVAHEALGADRARRGLGAPRGAKGLELADRVGARAGEARARSGLGGEGLLLRDADRGLPPAARRARRGGRAPDGLARRRAARPDRDRLARLPDQHLRRRRERDPARDRRHARAGAAACAPLAAAGSSA